MLRKFARATCILCILGFAGLFSGVTLAQTTDPLVGTWNFTATVTGGCTTNCKYIGMIAFNQGGTVTEQRGTAVEYSGLGYVDRTAVGKWQRSTNTTYPYTYTMKNFVFDSTGNLSGIVLANSSIKLSSTLPSLNGHATAKIFTASGTLIETVTVTIAGTRF